MALTYNANFNRAFKQATASSAVGNYMVSTIPNLPGFTLDAIPSTATTGAATGEWDPHRSPFEGSHSIWKEEDLKGYIR